MNYSKFCTVATAGHTVSSSFIIPSRLSKEKQEQLRAELQKMGINAVSADELIGKAQGWSAADSNIGQKSKAVLTEVMGDTKPSPAETSLGETSVVSVASEASVAKVAKASLAAEASIEADASEASKFFDEMKRITGGNCFTATAIGEGAVAINQITFAR